jgi:hypothetical protein
MDLQMMDIRQLEQSIVRPMLMLDFMNMNTKKDSRIMTLTKDILIGILIALVIMQ